MAVLYVSEYVSAPLVVVGQQLAVGSEPAVAEQHVAIGSSSAASSAFNAATKFIRVHTDAICSVAIGPVASVTAVATAKRMYQNSTEYFGVPPGQSYAIAVITNS